MDELRLREMVACLRPSFEFATKTRLIHSTVFYIISALVAIRSVVFSSVVLHLFGALTLWPQAMLAETSGSLPKHIEDQRLRTTTLSNELPSHSCKRIRKLCERLQEQKKREREQKRLLICLPIVSIYPTLNKNIKAHSQIFIYSCIT